MQKLLISSVLCILGIILIVVGIVTALPLLLCGCLGVLCLLASVVLAIEEKGK
ncbi:MAG: hypothetical protein IK016_09785 [Lachnospiraceae bacterium]|nr:hypothetical protein [Lachnospiraceae bacterium]